MLDVTSYDMIRAKSMIPVGCSIVQIKKSLLKDNKVMVELYWKKDDNLILSKFVSRLETLRVNGRYTKRRNHV